jgi:hypothetical protein
MYVTVIPADIKIVKEIADKAMFKSLLLGSSVINGFGNQDANRNAHPVNISVV